MIAVGRTPLADVVTADRLNPQPDGTVTVSNADGTVWSRQPGNTDYPHGYWEIRPEGAAGSYEKALLQGNVLVFNPIDPAGKAFPAAFAYFLVPNAS